MSELETRFGLVGILGRPNVGKSTLMNRLLGQKLAITTPKPQTTRDRIRGIRTFEDWQVVWVDTPGIHEAKAKLNRYMVDVALGTISEVDLCYVMVDASEAHRSYQRYLARAEEDEATDQALEDAREIVALVKNAEKPAFLILNKIDKIPNKEDLLAIIARYAELYEFAEVVPVSARSSGAKSNVEGLLRATREHLPVGEMIYDEDTLTDRTGRFMAKEIIREQLFLVLGQELPYQLAVDILAWEERSPQLLVIHANIHVARRSHKPIVVGRRGQKIQQVGQRSRENLERLFERKIYLDLRVKVDEGWLDHDGKLRELGYDLES